MGIMPQGRRRLGEMWVASSLSGTQARGRKRADRGYPHSTSRTILLWREVIVLKNTNSATG